MLPVPSAFPNQNSVIQKMIAVCSTQNLLAPNLGFNFYVLFAFDLQETIRTRLIALLVIVISNTRLDVTMGGVFPVSGYVTNTTIVVISVMSAVSTVSAWGGFFS